MKRYEIVGYPGPEHDPWDITMETEESPKGRWVRFEDVERDLRFAQRLTDLIRVGIAPVCRKSGVFTLDTTRYVVRLEDAWVEQCLFGWLTLDGMVNEVWEAIDRSDGWKR